jgi:hypothetical protein
MPIGPQVGKDFETASGLRATVKFKLDKPDKSGVLFAGSVRLNGDDELAGWRQNGVCPANGDYTLDSLWPADDSRQYTVIKETDDGIFRSFCTYYSEIGSLKHDNPQAKWALKIERDNSVPPMPTVEVIDLATI